MLRRMVKEAHHHNNSHIPVLLEAVLRILAPKPGEKYLDLTAGYGGHAREIISNLGSASFATLIDRDEHAIESLQSLAKEGAHIIHSDFMSAALDLARVGEQFALILIDLGVSSPHFDNAERGFSFNADAPLDMRMDQRQELTAQKLVNEASETELVQILREYGEEPKAKKIAQAIIKNRPIITTKELAQLVETLYGRRGKKHPATRTFQALRIAVNDELGQLKATLAILPRLLMPGGRVAIISFHSLEDRLVKQFLADQKALGLEAKLKTLTKKPISGADEDVFNPRARSAKLRAAVKINI